MIDENEGCLKFAVTGHDRPAGPHGSTAEPFHDDSRLRMVKAPRQERLRNDLCADPLVSEDFQQNGMGRTTVDDVRLTHTPGQCIQTGVNFG